MKNSMVVKTFKCDKKHFFSSSINVNLLISSIGDKINLQILFKMPHSKKDEGFLLGRLTFIGILDKLMAITISLDNKISNFRELLK